MNIPIKKYAPALIYAIFAVYNILTTQKNLQKTQKRKNEITMVFVTLLLSVLCHYGHTKIAWGILVAALLVLLFIIYEVIHNFKNKKIGGCAGTLAGCCKDGITQAKSQSDPCKN